MRCDRKETPLSGRSRALVYWVTTSILAIEGAVGGIMGMLQFPPFFGVIRELGYPAYFMTMLGLWYLLAGTALLAPATPRLKEWAYAGLIFLYVGAVASHAAAGSHALAFIAPVVFTGITLASWACRPVTRKAIVSNGPEFAAGVASSRPGLVVYWLATVIVAAELALGGVWDVLRIPYVRAVIDRLGFPPYVLTIIGLWKVPAAFVLLAPRFVRLKEWAYAGAMFVYVGAIVSHLVVDGGAVELVPLTCFTVLTAVSWALRPPGRGRQGSRPE